MTFFPRRNNTHIASAVTNVAAGWPTGESAKHIVFADTRDALNDCDM
jgi:hypothetical protein